MSKRLVVLLSAIAAGLAVASSPVVAQQKTVKACQEEWRANKAANQAAGVTEKSYVQKCRAGTVAAQPAPAAPAAKPTASSPATATQPTKTVKACRDEWRANKAANQAAGVTEKSYVDKCRAGTIAAQPAPSAPATANAPPAPARSRATTATAPTATPAPTRAPAAMGAGQFSSEAEAKARCPGDTVVWANLDSKIYHFNSNRNYGRTKNGAYMCERDTAAAGLRAAKNEKHP